ncbi:MAG: DMT family transporter [Candidatus Pelagadaptatus aseana]|uniref:DMT family transporter n=1 Tax=Candidatus Pelagadaptatus aseana TaxID=3120508 RepID=UPI0039B155C6
MVLKSPRSAIALLLFVSFVWGAEFALVDLAIEKVPTHAFNALRFALAGLCLLPLLKLEAPQPQHTKRTTITGLLLGFLLFVGFATQTEGLHYTSVSNAGFITGLNVPFVPLLGFLLFRSHVSLSAWGGVVAATVGLYFLTIGDKLSFNYGDVLVLICAVAFAAHIVMTGHFAGALPAIRLSVIQMFAVAGYSALASVSLELNHDFYQAPLATLSDPWVLSAILTAAILGSALAYWAQTASQKILQPHQVALIFATEPLFAHGTAAIFLGETLGMQGWLGAGLIVAGMLISELGDKKHPAEIHAIDHSAAPRDY